MAETSTRQKRLYRELKIALSNTGSDDLKAWGRTSAERLPRIAKRRVKNLGGLLLALAKFTGKELLGAVRSIGAGKFGTHIEQRSADAIDGTIDIAKRITLTSVAVGKALFADPRKNASGVLALALGFLAGSGGVDGDGGVPDTDIPLLGIGAHRSPLTHSIVAGTIVEGAILALADLADVVCEKLPRSKRDPFWDKLVAEKDTITSQLNKGASAGIAFHLGVDATLQPGAYHGLPGELPTEVHQTLLGLNAVAEGLDVGNKENTTGKKVVRGVKIAGGTAAKAAGVAARITWDFGKGFVSGLKGNAK